MAKSLDDVTVSKYCLPRMVMPSSNRMKACRNLRSESSSLQLQGQRKTLNISREKERNVEVQILTVLGNMDTTRHSCFIKILLRKLSEILQLKSEVTSFRGFSLNEPVLKKA